MSGASAGRTSERRPRALGASAGLLCALGVAACLGTPSPLAPGLAGPVGVPHRGVLSGGVAFPKEGPGFVRLRDNGVHWGTPRLVALLTAAAAEVERERPGPPLVVGDLSARSGGETSGHRSHRTGRDADLLFYSVTPDGRPVRTPGFVAFGADGLAKTDTGGQFVRLDVDRTWLLVRALLGSGEAEIQWLFVARWLEALLVEHAIARGEDLALVWRAQTVLQQPGDAAPHDDHFHLRIACTPEEAVAGCDGGPRWPWQPPLPALPNGNGRKADEDLLDALGLERESPSEAPREAEP